MSEDAEKKQIVKLSPSGLLEESHSRRRFCITLPRDMTCENAHQTPEVWQKIQEDRGKRLRLFDSVTLISGDGETMFDDCIVVKTALGKAYFSAPARIILVDRPTVCFESDGLRVVPDGTGYAVEQHVRGSRGEGDSWHREGFTYQTEAAAKASITNRQPVQVG